MAPTVEETGGQAMELNRQDRQVEQS